MGCPFSVHSGSVRIVERFGAFSRVAEPGLNLLWGPCCVETIAGTLSLRIEQLGVKCQTKSKDNVFLNIEVSVQYRVKPDKVYDAFYKLTDASKQIEAYVFDVVRSEVPKVNLDDVFLLKEELADRIKER